VCSEGLGGASCAEGGSTGGETGGSTGGETGAETGGSTGGETGAETGAETGTETGEDGSRLGSYIYQITVEADPEVGTDLDGDGQPNNALGPMYASLIALTGAKPMNESLAGAIAEGSLALGLWWEQYGLDVTNAGIFDLYFLTLHWEDGLPVADDAVLDQGNPALAFPGASTSEGALTTGTLDVSFSFPFAETPILLEMLDTSAAGTVSVDANGVAITEGILRGVVLATSLLNWANDYLSSDACSCVDVEHPAIDLGAGLSSAACPVGPDSTACGEEDDLCKYLIDFCSLMLPVLGQSADMDTNGDNVNDAFSALFYFEAEGAEILVQ